MIVELKSIEIKIQLKRPPINDFLKTMKKSLKKHVNSK
jgi:hypothetical protein